MDDDMVDDDCVMDGSKVDGSLDDRWKGGWMMDELKDHGWMDEVNWIIVIGW